MAYIQKAADQTGQSRQVTRFAAVASLLLFASTGIAGNKLAEALERVDADTVTRVIVQFDHPAAEHHQRVLGRHGLHLKDHLGLVSGSVIEASGRQLRELANDPNVERIVPDQEVRTTDFSGTKDFGWMTVLDVANTSTPLPYNGAGIAVAIIDSGVNPLEDLQGNSGHSRIVYNESFVPRDDETEDDHRWGTQDDYGHGTHVAGIVAGSGQNSSGGRYDYTIRGIAPAVNIVSLRVLDKNGSGKDSTVISAIQRAIQLKSIYNIRVINLSLGRNISSSYTTDPLCQAVQQAWAAGIVVVVAAGNGGRSNAHDTNGYGTIKAPGNSPYAITVGAMNTSGTLTRADDKIASYSSKGPTLIDHIVKPDIVAPGNQILSLRANDSFLDKSHPENRVPIYVYSREKDDATPNYYQLSGTSMAAPMVSGAAALLLQQKPWLTPDQIKAKLMKTSYKAFPALSVAANPATGAQYLSQYDIFTIGAGSLDIGAAINAYDDAPANRSAMSPKAVYNASNNTVSVVNGTNIVWGDNIVWGENIVWGDNVFLSGTSILWGSGMVWGNSTMLGFSVVWGNNIVWGDGNATPDGMNTPAIALQGDR